MNRWVTALVFVAAVARGGAVDLRVLVPLYSYPQWYTTNNYLWHDIAVQGSNVPIVAIIDPADGPGSGFPNVDYAQGMDDLLAGDVGIIGYVDTAYAARSTSLVNADVDAYAADARVSGIFLDQVDASTANFTYYTNLFAHIRSKPALTNLVLNSGPDLDVSYLAYVDSAVIFEQSVGWEDHVPNPLFAGYGRERFSVLLHTCPTPGEMETNIARAVHRNVGWVYVTDDVMPNPWDAPPTYWTQMVDFVTAYRAAAAVAVQPGTTDFSMTFSTVPREPCRIEAGDPSAWTNFTAVLHPTSTTVVVTDSNPTSARSFRLRLLPP